MSETRPMAPMQIGTTNRGFALYEFIDRYGEQCSLQKSSLATEDCIWFGVTDDKRMHLTVEMVAAVLPALQHFVATGELPGAPSTPPLPPSPRCAECGHTHGAFSGYCFHTYENGERCDCIPSTFRPAPVASGAPAGETPTLVAMRLAVSQWGEALCSDEPNTEKYAQRLGEITNAITAGLNAVYTDRDRLRERAERAERRLALALMELGHVPDPRVADLVLTRTSQLAVGPFRSSLRELTDDEVRAALLRSSASTTDSGSGT